MLSMVFAGPAGSKLLANFVRQPRFHNAPVAENRGLRNVEQFSGFLNVQPSEKPALDHQSVAWIHAPKLLVGHAEQIVQVSLVPGRCTGSSAGRDGFISAFTHCESESQRQDARRQPRTQSQWWKQSYPSPGSALLREKPSGRHRHST